MIDFFYDFNSWSAEEFLSRISLPLANDGKSYICPECKNGTGDTGDGIKPRQNSKGQTRWKCFKCGKDFSNFDLAAAVFGLDAEHNAAEAARRLKEEFGLYDENETFSSSRKKKSARSAVKSSATVDGKNSETFKAAKSKLPAPMSEQVQSTTASEPKNYLKLYEFCRGNVAKFLEKHGGSYRGLTAETFEKYGLGVHDNFGVEGEVKVPALIIPYDDFHFAARKLEEVADNQKVTQHGKNAGIYEPLPISTEYPIFIVEGEIDALSIVQEVGHIGFRCIATGGAIKWKKVVPELEKKFGGTSDKPSFIVAFDNDDTGKAEGLQLVTALRSAGYPAEIFFFAGDMAGEHVYRKSNGSEERIVVKKLDANDLLQKDAKDNGRRLVDKVFEAIEQTEKTMRVQATAMKKREQEERQAAMDKSGMRIFSFADYFAADFFGDIALTAKYSERKTGFENLDAAQIFMPGLYVLGALPATGKTTFVWQLLNQLAEKGEPCIYCSYEMSRAELFTKSITRELYKRYPKMSERLNLTSANIRRGACSDMEELHKQAAAFARSSTNLRVVELSNMGIAELIDKLKPLVADVDKSSVICLDYLQIVPSKDIKTSSSKEKIDDVMLRLKDFQRETNSTVIVISSFNRENYYQPVSYKAFKESGAIEYSADVVWGLENDIGGIVGADEREKFNKVSREKVRKIKFSCLKNRNGGAYECFFRYHAAYDYFEPCEEKEDYDVVER